MSNPWTDTNKPAQVFTKYLLSGGKLTETTDDNAALAKNSDRTFYVKATAATGEPYNPWNLMNLSGELNIVRAGVPKYQWLKVNEKSYQYYLKFLETQNSAHLSSARGAL